MNAKPSVCGSPPVTIPRGTTPTIIITFKTVDVSNIVEAWLTIKQKSVGVVIDRDLSSATVGEKALTWRLTQEETLALNKQYDVTLQCRYLLDDGTAGTSPAYTTTAYEILKDGVIS